MTVIIQREYKLKFYLNAEHFVILNGGVGETHPHTWEFCLHIMVLPNAFTPFHVYECAVNEFLAPFQGQVLNKMECFATRQPTLENIVETFAAELDRIVIEKGGMLLSVEGSEGPTRSFIVRINDDEGPTWLKSKQDADIIDAVLDEALR